MICITIGVLQLLKSIKIMIHTQVYYEWVRVANVVFFARNSMGSEIFDQLLPLYVLWLTVDWKHALDMYNKQAEPHKIRDREI